MIARSHLHTFQQGNRSFDYRVNREDQRRLKIEVFPDLNVVVHVPLNATKEEIEGRLRKKASWVFRSLAELAQYHPLPTPKHYRSGESVFYLGRQYYLKVQSAEQSKVRLIAGKLEVSVPGNPEKEIIESLVQGWYRKRALEVFPKRIESCRSRVADPTQKTVPLRVRQMKTRWGSCSAHGVITLNPELMKVPSPCMDYVILHELCHLRHLNHGKEFYALLEAVCPNWRIQKHRLNEFASKS